MRHNDCNSGKNRVLRYLSLCPLCPYRRRADRPVLLAAGRHSGTETVFIHWRRTCPCGLRCHVHCRRAEVDGRYATDAGRYGSLCRPAAPHGTEYKDQGRHRHRYDLSGGAGHRVSADEPVLHLVQSLRRCLQHAVRLHLHSDAVQKRGLAVRRSVRGGRGGVSAILQQDFCRDL